MIEKLLSIDHKGLTAYRWQGGALIEEGAFTPEGESLDAFSAYLAQGRRKRYAILINRGDESYAHDHIPPLGRRDRRAMLERKCHQHFPDSDFATSVSLRHDKLGENIAIAALTKPETLLPWLNRMALAGSRLGGTYTLSQLAPALLADLQHDGGQCLLIVVLSQSIREIFVDNGQVCFSRQLGRRKSESFSAQQLSAEVQALRQYLQGRQLIKREAELPVYLLPDPLDQRINDPRPEPDNHVHFSCLDPQRVAQQMKIASPPEGLSNDAIFLTLLARKQPQHQLAPERFRQNDRQARFGRILSGIGLGVLIGSLCFATAKLHLGLALTQEEERLHARLALLQVQHRQLLAELPGHGIETDALLKLDAEYRHIRQQQILPESSYHRLGELLGGNEKIDLDTIDWKNEHAKGTEEIRLRGQADSQSSLDDFIRRLTKEGGFIITQTLSRPDPREEHDGSRDFQLSLSTKAER